MKAANVGRCHLAFISRNSPGKSNEINSSRGASGYLNVDAMELTSKIYLRSTIIFACAYALEWKMLIVSQPDSSLEDHHQLGAFPSSFWMSRSIREVRVDDVTIRQYHSLWDMSGGVGYRRGSDLNENGRNEASDNALESPSAAELISIKCSGGSEYLGGGSWRHYPVIS